MKAAHKERLENEEGRIPDAVESSVSFLFLLLLRNDSYSLLYCNILCEYQLLLFSFNFV